MTDIHTDFPFSRRDLLKGGGALIVGFSMSGALPGVASAARGDVAGSAGCAGGRFLDRDP